MNRSRVRVPVSALCGNSSVGRALASQAGGREFEPRLPLEISVELKAVSFEPEFAGKLNFYVNAVNELMKSESANPTIGLLICKDKDQTEVQWAFQGIKTPMGVATYDNIRLQEIKSQLPSEEAIQKRLEQAEEEYILKLKEKNK